MGFMFIDFIINKLVNLTGTNYDELNFFVCMLISLPLGYLNRFIKNQSFRLVYGLITGLILQIQVCELETLHVVIAALNTYLFITFFGRKVSSFYVIIISMAHLSYFSIMKMLVFNPKSKLGVENLYMTAICKFSSVAFNYEDGGKTANEVQSSYHREKMIKEKPTFLEFFSYIFYFPSALVGPSFEFKDFIKFIRLEDEYRNINWSLANKSTLKDISLVCIFVIIKLFLGNKFSSVYCGTEAFIEHNIFYKIFYFTLAVIVLRSTFYIAWKLSQAGVDFVGLNYNRKVTKDGQVVEAMDKMDVCNLNKIEFEFNPRTTIHYWNRTIHLWLKYYIFMRLINLPKPFKNNKFLASFLTFMVSALWHGLNPSFYLFFLNYFMIDHVAAYFDEKYDLFNKAKSWQLLPKILLRALVFFIISYFGMAINFLTIEANFNYFKAFNFVPVVSLFGTWVWTKFAKKMSNNSKNLDHHKTNKIE